MNTKVNMKHYRVSRDDIRSGDLLIWSGGQTTWFSKMTSWIVKYFTKSIYSHAGIAWRVKDRLFVIEAVIPLIRIYPVSKSESFYRFDMELDWSDELEQLALEHVGEYYSLMDDVRGLLGKTKLDNDRWQCAELAVDFYRKAGIELGDSYTPAKLVSSVESRLGKRADYFIVEPK